MDYERFLAEFIKANAPETSLERADAYARMAMGEIISNQELDRIGVTLPDDIDWDAP